MPATRRASRSTTASERGRELLLKLVRTADVLVENFVPGKLEKMGLAPERLHDHNERLVIVRVSGWGQTGPFAHKPGFGTLVEAMSGFASMNGYADRPPVLPPLATADMLSGLYGASAALIALRHIEISGRQGTGHRSIAARADAFHPGSGGGELPVDGRAHPAQRQPCVEHRAAQCLRMQRRQVRRAVGLHAIDGRATVHGHGARGSHQPIRAFGPTPTGCATTTPSIRSSRTSCGNGPRRKISSSSIAPASRSARSTTRVT